MGVGMSINFKDKVRVNKDADIFLKSIKDMEYDTFELMQKVNEINDMDVARRIVLQLLLERNQTK